MKKHLLFIAVLFACNISKIFAQHHHQNNHHENHQNNGYHNGGNSNYTAPYCAPATSVFKINVQQPYRTQLIVDGQNFGLIQNLYNGVELEPGKHFVQLYRKGNRCGGYMVFSGDVCIKPNNIVNATLSMYDGLVLNEMPAYNNQCGNTGYYSDYDYAVDERTFCTFKNVVKNAWFDSDKQKLICDFLSRNYVSSSQVEQLLGMIDFESTKLKIAKEAYTKVVDKNNYYTVFSQFDFESSKRELSNFMARC